VIPGHESDEEVASEAETEEPQPARAVAAERPGVGPVRRRFGTDRVPRAQQHKGSAALRDVRDDFGEAEEQHEDSGTHGEATELRLIISGDISMAPLDNSFSQIAWTDKEASFAEGLQACVSPLAAAFWSGACLAPIDTGHKALPRIIP